MAVRLPIGNTTTFVYNSPKRTDRFPTVYCTYSDGQHSVGINLHYFLKKYRILQGMTPAQKTAQRRRNKERFVQHWEPQWKRLWERQIVEDPMVKPMIDIIADVMDDDPKPREIQTEMRGFKDEGVTDWIMQTAFRKYSNKHISRIIETTRGLPTYPEFKP